MLCILQVFKKGRSRNLVPLSIINFPLPALANKADSSRITFYPIKFIQILSLDDIESGSLEAFEQRDNLLMRDCVTFARISDEATAPVVDGEGVGEAAVGAFPPIQEYDSVAY